MAIFVHPQSKGCFFLSIFCWFCEAVEPAMQDIRWGWNILKDWKLDDDERGTAVSAS